MHQKTHYSVNKLLFLAIILMVACKKDPIEKPVNVKTDTANITKNFVLISQEGNFNWNNAELTLFDILSGNITENVYQSNNQVAFGDVCQSISILNDKIYCVLNNSGSIKILNVSNFQQTHEITGLHSPRYFLPISQEKAYVSDLYEDNIYVINLQNNSIDKKIPCSGWTENMLSYQGYTYVTNRQKKQVYIIDEASDMITDSILVAYGGNSIQMDKYGLIWVLCSGDQSLGEAAGLYQISPSTKTSSLKISLPNQELAWRLSSNNDKSKLYFIQKHIYEVDVTQTNIEHREIISGNNKNFYGLKLHPDNDFIYVSDAIDYIQKGSIEIYDRQFNLSTTFKAGIIPGDFVFF